MSGFFCTEITCILLFDENSVYPYTYDWEIYFFWYMSDFLWIEQILNYVVYGMDFLSVCVVLYWFVYAILMFLRMHIEYISWEKAESIDLTLIRIRLWAYLLLALELFVASDIVMTILNPSYEQLLQLSLLVVIRIVLTFFLQREMNELRKDWIDH